jgi:hypothetical protein
VSGPLTRFYWQAEGLGLGRIARVAAGFSSLLENGFLGDIQRSSLVDQILYLDSESCRQHLESTMPLFIQCDTLPIAIVLLIHG